MAEKSFPMSPEELAELSETLDRGETPDLEDLKRLVGSFAFAMTLVEISAQIVGADLARSLHDEELVGSR